MADLYGIFLSSQNKQLGERFFVQLKASNPVGAPLPDLYVSSTFTVYDSLNNPVIPTASVTNLAVARNTIIMRYPVDCRPNQQITTAGTYRFLFSVKMSDGDVQTFEQVCLISANP